MDLLGPPISLRTYLEACLVDPDLHAWMVTDDDGPYRPDTLLYPVLADLRGLSPEEYDTLEDRVLGEGYGNAMNAGQFADVVANLAMQRPGYTEADLMAAINYYDERDAYLVWPS